MQGDPSDNCTVVGDNNDKYGDRGPYHPRSWRSSTGHGTLFFPPKTVRSKTVAACHYFFPSPCQFNVDRQSAGCICPEKRLQSTTIASAKPYHRSRRGNYRQLTLDGLPSWRIRHEESYSNENDHEQGVDAGDDRL